MPYLKPFLLFFVCLFISCTDVDLIDDYLPPVLRITTPFSEITLGDSYSFEASYFNNIGEFVPNSQLEWESSDSEILTIDSHGNATPLKIGTVQIIVKTTSSEGSVLQDEINITIQSNVVLVPPEEPIEEPSEEEQIPESNTQTPTITITNGISQITAETNYQLELAFQDAMGNLADVPNSNWTSSNEALLQVDETGTLQAIAAGTVTLTVSVQVSNTIISAQSVINVIAPVVAMVTSYSGEVVSKSSYTLEGGFTLASGNDGLILSLDESYKASTALPGLYVYLSNNANTTAGAYEIGAVTVFNGAHSYNLPNSIELMDYKYILYWCKPFNVKVGEAKIYD